MTSDGDPLLIIGAGAAGYGLLRAFRRRNRDAPVSLMTDDDGIVYARAELSRALATGKAARELILASAAEMAERYRVRLICRTRAHAIDRANRIVLTEDGPRAYDRLVLASGAEPLRPSIRGSGGHRLLTLSTLDEYRYLERELAGRDRVALLGGTLAACETALHLVAAGKTVVLFETASRLLGGRLPALSARRMAGLLEEAGVRLRLESGLARIDQEPDALALTTLSGQQFSSDVVLAMCGMRPRAALAGAAGLDVGRGIRVDAAFRTADPHIFAVGECAEVGGHPITLPEDVDASVNVLAGVLCGTSEARMRWRPRMRRVRVGDCPLVLCEPPRLVGEWQETATPRGVRAIFFDQAGRPRGFVLIGNRAEEAEHWFSRL